MTSRSRHLPARVIFALGLMSSCSSNNPPLLTEATTPATTFVSTTASPASIGSTSLSSTTSTVGVETSSPAPAEGTTSGPTSSLSSATPDSANEAAIRADVIADQQTYYDEILKLPDTDTAKILDGSIAGSPLYQSTKKNLDSWKADGTRARLAANPVNVIKVGKIKLLDKVTAEVELCLSNNLVLYRKRADGTEEIVNDTFGTAYTTEEWKFSGGRWKSVVLRKQQAQEGNQCDRLIP